jgi:hypothetical protein
MSIGIESMATKPVAELSHKEVDAGKSCLPPRASIDLQHNMMKA